MLRKPTLLLPAWLAPPDPAAPQNPVREPGAVGLKPALSQRMLAYKRARTVSLGPFMRLMFEDEVTLQHQVQTIAHIERISDPDALAREYQNYAHLMPDGRSWRATLMVELPEAAQREHHLPLMNEAVHQVYAQVPRLLHVRAEANEDQPDRHRSRLSAVHFLRFTWPEDMQRALLQGASVMLGCDHPRYAWRRLIPVHTLALLRADLAALPAGTEGVGSTANASALA